MSHLFKNDKKKLILIKLFFFSPLVYIFLNTLNIYSGNKFLYIIFSLVSFYLIFFSVRKKFFFYETFFSFFLFMGFWFKFSFILSFTDGFSEGLGSIQSISPENYDLALLISIIGISTFIIFGYLREKFVCYPKNINLIKNTKLYEKNRNNLIILFIIFILIITFSNYFFQIYQRGLVGTNQNFLINGVIKTSLLYLLTLCSTFFLYFDSAAYKKVYPIILFLIIFETFLSSISMLSRGMIFNSMAVIYAFYKFSSKIKLKLKIKFYLKFLIMLLLFFIVSVASVNYLRIVHHNIGVLPEYFTEKQSIIKKHDHKVLSVDQTLFENLNSYSEIALRGFRSLLVNRWVGIDSMLLVTKNKEILNFNFFKESLKEKFDVKSPSFYETKFKIYTPDHYKETSYKKGNTLPGLITYLFFSGSYIFLIISIMFFCFIATFLEYLIFKTSNSNLVASGLIGMVISYRFAHFGYLPAQSYLLFGSILGVIFFLFLFKFITRFIKT